MTDFIGGGFLHNADNPNVLTVTLEQKDFITIIKHAVARRNNTEVTKIKNNVLLNNLCNTFLERHNIRHRLNHADDTITLSVFKGDSVGLLGLGAVQGVLEEGQQVARPDRKIEKWMIRYVVEPEAQHVPMRYRPITRDEVMVLISETLASGMAVQREWIELTRSKRYAETRREQRRQTAKGNSGTNLELS